MEKFSAWYNKPFSSDMDALDWFLFVGLILTIMILWKFILNHIVAE